MSTWFKYTLFATLITLTLTLLPFTPLALCGAVGLLIILPGLQLARWLDLTPTWQRPETLLVSLALGLVTSPILVYWSSLIFGFTRPMLLILLPLYVLLLAKCEKLEVRNVKFQISHFSFIPLFLALITALGVFLSYFELQTNAGYYPVQMEDWQKHYGVAFALRQTGIPPTSPFFYGLYPDESLVYYYFLHLNGATLDLLQGGAPSLHASFVTVIVFASLTFSGMVFYLAQAMFNSPVIATWSLAFATLIGGLDIIPILQRTIEKYRHNFPDGSLPWAVFMPREHIDNWISALSLRLNTFYAHHVWVPQHLTGLTILCLGCYLYLKIPQPRKLLVIWPILLFALLGHSTWIAVIVAAAWAVFALGQFSWAIWESKSLDLPAPNMESKSLDLPLSNLKIWTPKNLILSYVSMAALFSLIAAPFIMTLLGPQAPKSGIVFEIPKLDGWAILHPIQTTFGPAIWARLLDLPLHFTIEMGALLWVGLAGLALYWRRNYFTPPSIQGGTEEENTPPLRGGYQPVTLLPFLTLILLIGLITVSCFASGHGWAGLGLVLNNDLGLRALMPGQLVLALFAGYFMGQFPTLAQPRWLKTVTVIGLSVLIGLGVTSSAWEFVSMGLAKYTLEPQLSPTVYQTLRDLPSITPPIDKPFPIVQHRIHREVSRFQLSLGQRLIAFATGEAIVFHPHVHELALAHNLSQQAFDNGLPVWSYQMFNNLGANYIFVTPAEREAMRHPEKYELTQYFKQVYQHGDVTIYKVQPLPYRPIDPQTNRYVYQDTPQATFDNGAIAFEGYFIDPKAVYPGQSQVAEGRGLVTAWQLSQTVDKNYTVFIHFVDASGNIIAQADHQLWAWAANREGPTTIWPSHLTQLDIIPIPSAALEHEPLTIRLGLWLPETGQQFPVTNVSLTVDDAGRLVIGELEP